VTKELGTDPNLTIDWVQNGEQAIDYLEGRPPYAERRVPDVILLDLKLPRMDGFAFLEWQRRAPKPHSLVPVVILSISNLPEDIRRAQTLGARAYLVKQTTWTRLGRQLSLLDLSAGSADATTRQGPQRLTVTLGLPNARRITVTASADSAEDEVRYVYSGDTSALHPFAEKGTVGFLRWYMRGCAFNLGADIDIVEH
jgi:CheY-like chemotaxis protein